MLIRTKKKKMWGVHLTCRTQFDSCCLNICYREVAKMAQHSSNGQFLSKQWVLSAMLPATKDILWRFSIKRRQVCSCHSHFAGTQCQNQRNQIHVGGWCCVIRRGQRYVSRILVDKPCHHPQPQWHHTIDTASVRLQALVLLHASSTLCHDYSRPCV